MRYLSVTGSPNQRVVRKTGEYAIANRHLDVAELSATL